MFAVIVSKCSCARARSLSGESSVDWSCAGIVVTFRSQWLELDIHKAVQKVDEQVLVSARTRLEMMSGSGQFGPSDKDNFCVHRRCCIALISE